MTIYLSGKPLSHHSHQHPHSPDPNHLITDSPHLPQLIKLPFIKAHSTHAPRPVYHSLPRTVPDSQSTNVYLPSSSPRASWVPPVLFPFVILPTALALLHTIGHSQYCACHPKDNLLYFPLPAIPRSHTHLLFNKPACHSLTCLSLTRFVTIFVFYPHSPHCSSPSTPTTAPLKTPLSNSWSLQTIPHSSASSRTVTSLLTDRRLRSRLSGAV